MKHLLANCPIAKDLWDMIFALFEQQYINLSNYKTQLNLKEKNKGENRKQYSNPTKNEGGI